MTADDRRGSGGYDTEPRRSIFASLWFRVLLVVILLGVAGVLAVPYVLDVMNPPPPKPMAVGTPASPALPLPAPAPAPESAQNPPVAPGPSAPAPAPAAAPATKEEKQTERPKTAKPEKQPARRGGVVKPSLPLRDAIALSKDLAAEGLKVQVRRSGAPASATAAPAGSAGGEVLYRVRVGPYPDRAAATSAQKELEGKGYRPFIARR